MNLDLPVIAGVVSSVLFAPGTLPMLVQAAQAPGRPRPSEQAGRSDRQPDVAGRSK